MRLRDFFKKYKGKEMIFFKPNGGNWGDRIIRMGAEKLAKMEGVIIKDVGKTYSFFEGKPIYIHGVGGIGNTYINVAGCSKRLCDENPDSEIVFGPSTAMTSDDDLKRLINEFGDIKKDFIFFARDETSYKFMLENFKFNIYLDHCPSLTLDKNDFNHYVCDNTNYLLFREDVERIPLPNNLSLLDFDLVIDPVNAGTFEEWVQLHATSEKILTNRLHSAILGLILGKDVTLFNNFYHKNRSVWEYSLKERGVKWLN